jgi:hypothetical protein
MKGITLHSPGARVQAQLRFSQEHPEPHEHKGNQDFSTKRMDGEDKDNPIIIMITCKTQATCA